MDFSFQISEFRFQISDVRFKIVDFRFPTSISVFRIQISDISLQISDFRPQISDLRFQISETSDFKFRISDHRLDTWIRAYGICWGTMGLRWGLVASVLVACFGGMGLHRKSHIDCFSGLRANAKKWSAMFGQIVVSGFLHLDMWDNARASSFVYKELNAHKSP